jgi:predicted nucleic acid-binding protein
MPRFVIDPPTLLEIAAAGLSINPKHRLVAPNAIRSQALELLLQRVRSGELTEQAALDLHERITEMKMRLLGDRVSRRTAWRIARDHDWTTLRQAEYLAVAKLQADALTTVDPELAAKAEGIVPVAPLSDLFAD